MEEIEEAIKTFLHGVCLCAAGIPTLVLACALDVDLDCVDDERDVAGRPAHAQDLVESLDLRQDRLVLLLVDLVVEGDEPALKDHHALCSCWDGADFGADAFGKVASAPAAGQELFAQDADDVWGLLGVEMVSYEHVHEFPKGGAPVLGVHYLLGFG